MSVAPAPSASRGDIVIQPSYFTSSLFVHPLRDDILTLIHLFHEQYQTRQTQPFPLFKNIWNAQGWPWMHFKVLDHRTRDTFLKVTTRLFLERTVKTEAPLSRVVALFGLYTFFYTQPSHKAPPIHAITHIPIPLDVYSSLIALPSTLTTAHLLPLQPSAAYILITLLKDQVFHILPSSELLPLNPRELPREIFRHDAAVAPDPEAPKKKGRPTKREKMKKAKDAVGNLDKWLEKTSYTPQASTSTPGASSSDPESATTHILLSHPPMTTRINYRTQKSHLLNAIDPPFSGDSDTKKTEGREALERANEFVLARVKKVDQLAAEKGMEVGSEGGERTGLERLERAVGELGSGGALGRRGGILGLMEGGGMEEMNNSTES